MKRIRLIVFALIITGAMIYAPTVMAGEPVTDDEIVVQDDSDVKQETTVADETATEESTDDSITDMQGGTEKCVDTDGCDTDEPECVEDCGPPVCTENCGEDQCVEGLDCDPDPCLVDPFSCEDPTDCEANPLADECTLGEEDDPVGGGTPTGALPFTGISDFMIPIAFGFLLLMTGAMLYQYASLQDTLGALRKSAMANRVRSGFGEALDRLKK